MTARTAGARGAVAACFLMLATASGLAQLASRPVDEWIKVLDSPERLADLQIDRVVAALNLRPGEVVADLGAGSGPFVPALAKAVTPQGRAYAVEIDKAFFPHIEARARAAGASNVRVVLGEFTDPKLPAADVDVAFLHDVLHHIADRPAYLANLVKYLKPRARGSRSSTTTPRTARTAPTRRCRCRRSRRSPGSRRWDSRSGPR